MKSKNHVDLFVEELGEPVSSDTMRQATTRVLENLSMEYAGMKPESGICTIHRTAPKQRWAPITAIAAALLAAVVLVSTLTVPGSGQTIAKRVNGKLIVSGDPNAFRTGQVLRTGSKGRAVLALRDGTQIEMSSAVELSINRASDGIQINLAEGNLIVTAAKQHNGHLYVKTKDCLVSVVGTVFSVKAESTGSRVAVIEGEVHVQHGDVSQTLLPGQQVSTNPAMTAMPLQSEIGWSQDAVSHIAMLQQSTTPLSTASAAGQSDAAPIDPNGGPILLHRTFTFQLGRQFGNETPNVLPETARQGVLRYFAGWNVAQSPNSFSFIVTGIQGRTVSFENDKGVAFSYGCANCSFIVSEAGVADASSSTDPGYVFKLSADGSTLSATCRAMQCGTRVRFGQDVLLFGLDAPLHSVDLLSGEFRTILPSVEGDAGRNNGQLTIAPHSVANSAQSSTSAPLTIPVSQLAPPPDNQVTVFSVTK